MSSKQAHLKWGRARTHLLTSDHRRKSAVGFRANGGYHTGELKSLFESILALRNGGVVVKRKYDAKLFCVLAVLASGEKAVPIPLFLGR